MKNIPLMVICVLFAGSLCGIVKLRQQNIGLMARVQNLQGSIDGLNAKFDQIRMRENSFAERVDQLDREERRRAFSVADIENLVRALNAHPLPPLRQVFDLSPTSIRDLDQGRDLNARP